MIGGVVVPYWLDRPPGEAVDVALAAEEFGYPELWLGEMLHFDAFALAGAIAVRTQNLTLTVGPLPLGLRDPVGLAMGVASVATLGGRPARLALGASNPTVVTAWHGRSFGGEADHICEAVALIRSVLAGERTGHRGYFSSHGFRSPLAPQPAHLTVAGVGPKMLQAAAACADRVVVNLVPPSEAARVRAAAGLPVAVWLVVGVDPDEEGWAQVRQQLALYLAAPGYAQVFRRLGMSVLVEAARAGASRLELASLLREEDLAHMTALGDLDQVRRQVERYRRAGAEVMAVPVTGGDPGGRRTLSLLAG